MFGQLCWFVWSHELGFKMGTFKCLVLIVFTHRVHVNNPVLWRWCCFPHQKTDSTTSTVNYILTKKKTPKNTWSTWRSIWTQEVDDVVANQVAHILCKSTYERTTKKYATRFSSMYPFKHFKRLKREGNRGDYIFTHEVMTATTLGRSDGLNWLTWKAKTKN